MHMRMFDELQVHCTTYNDTVHCTTFIVRHCTMYAYIVRRTISAVWLCRWGQGTEVLLGNVRSTIMIDCIMLVESVDTKFSLINYVYIICM